MPFPLPLISSSQTPHSGYHWDGSSRGFFEGWYFRVTLPALGDSVAFMYSIQDPQGNQPHSGGAAQILGPKDTTLCRTFPSVETFWADGRSLALGHWGKTNPSFKLAPRYLDPTVFDAHIQEGYQVTATWHQGKLFDPTTGHRVQWQYRTQPLDLWGDRHTGARSTGGWLSRLPIYEPGWQVLMAYGLATGWIDWHGQRHTFTQVPAYSEKNWGGAFPHRWFWIHCNSFPGHPDLSLTAAGGERRILGHPESVALIGIHYQGQFYEFAPWNATLHWHIHPWGSWEMYAESSHWAIALTATTRHPGTLIRTPTQTGLRSNCRDTTRGHLKLELRSRTLPSHSLLQTESPVVGLEVGGEFGHTPWQRRHPP